MRAHCRRYFIILKGDESSRKTFRYWTEIEIGVEIVDTPRVYENPNSGEASLEPVLSA
jgi:hypothetical protein